MPSASVADDTDPKRHVLIDFEMRLRVPICLSTLEASLNEFNRCGVPYSCWMRAWELGRARTFFNRIET